MPNVLYAVAVLLFLAILVHEWIATRARRQPRHPGTLSAEQRAHVLDVANRQQARVLRAEAKR